MGRSIRISPSASGTTLAEGTLGWSVTPFEGNNHVLHAYLRTRAFKVSYVPGICIYEVLFVWLDLHLDEGDKLRNLG